VSASAKARAPRRRVLGVRRFKGCLLSRVGRQTVVVTTPMGGIWGWAASWRQARAVVNSLVDGAGEDQA
jgi:hypothetical protein